MEADGKKAAAEKAGGKNAVQKKSAGENAHNKSLYMIVLVGNVISTTPQISSIQKIVGICKKTFWLFFREYITEYP